MFIEAEPGSSIDREARFGRAHRHKRRPAHSGGSTPPAAPVSDPPAQGDAIDAVPTPAPPAAAPTVVESTVVTSSPVVPGVTGDEVAVLRAELAAERRSRAWLEGRLEELDQRLRRAQAAERASQNAAAHDQVAFLGFQASLTAEQSREADREALELWVLEAQLHAEAAEALSAAPLRVEPIHVIAEPVVDRRLDEKLATARIAIEAAEARAAHNAAQVRRLSEELASARVEQTRTLNRLRELEQKLQGLEVRADLLDSIVTERTPPAGTRDLELPADAVAPISPQRPSLVFTETEHGTQLAPVETAEAEDDAVVESLDEVGESGLSLEDFEPTPYRGAAVKPLADSPAPASTGASFEDLFGDETPEAESRAVATEAPASERQGVALELADALAEFFGAEAPAAPSAAPEPQPESSIGLASLDEEPVGGPPPGVTLEDPLTEALALWGQGPTVAFEVAGVTDVIEQPAPSTPVKPLDPPLTLERNDEDPFAGLAAAMSELERPAAARLAASPETITPSPEDSTETLSLDDAPGDLTLEDDPYQDLAGSSTSRVASRADLDFLGSEADTDTNVEVVPLDAPEAEESATTEATAPATAPPKGGGILAARGGGISTSLFDAVHRAERERHEAAEVERPRLADLQRQRAEAEEQDESKLPPADEGATTPGRKGRANMVDALMRFMGPQ